MAALARAATSIVAVSRMSWLVAPRWTSADAGPPTDRVSASTSGTTGLPLAAAARPIAAMSYDSTRQARPIASACSVEMMPARASARASAASTSSIAPSHISSPSAAAAAPRARIGSNRPPAASDIEEGRLVFALQADVEAVAAIGRFGHQRRAMAGSPMDARTGSVALASGSSPK